MREFTMESNLLSLDPNQIDMQDIEVFMVRCHERMSIGQSLRIISLSELKKVEKSHNKEDKDYHFTISNLMESLAKSTKFFN
jgi:hypothetical protein